MIAISGIPRSINKEYAAVQYRASDSTNTYNTNIIVKGKLYKRLFSNPKFVGSISIDNFEYSKKHQLFDITFTKSIQASSGYLIYHVVENGVPLQEALGVIWMSENFSQLTILVFEPFDSQQRSTKDLIISAPANTRTEAIQIFEQLNPDHVQ